MAPFLPQRCSVALGKAGDLAQLRAPGEKCAPRFPRAQYLHLAQAHRDSLVAVVCTALLQHAEPESTVGVDTLLGEDVLCRPCGASQEGGLEPSLAPTRPPSEPLWSPGLQVWPGLPPPRFPL